MQYFAEQIMPVPRKECGRVERGPSSVALNVPTGIPVNS